MSSTQSEVLCIVLAALGNSVEKMLRTCVAVAVTLPDELVELPHEWGLGRLDDPSPACLKLWCRQLAVAACTLPGVCATVSTSQLAVFVTQHCRLVRRRFKHTQCWYVELGVLPSGPPLLTLLVPPRNHQQWPAWAARQPTASDDCFGVHQAGARVNVERLLQLDFLPMDLRVALVEGHRYQWSQWPARCHKRNYHSCHANLEHCAPEFDRLIEMGLCEGPLDYVPWIVNPIACILKWAPALKVRNVIDSLRSGVNECMVRTACKLDMVDNVVPRLRRGMGISKLDLTDAFLCWPIHARHCEVQGFCHPRTCEFYRYRFMPFGLTQAPGIQQRWARVLMELVQRQGLRYLSPALPAAQPCNLTVLGGYLDDFAFGHSPALRPWDWQLQFYSVACLLAHYGFPVKHAKNQWPALCCEYTGIMLDAERGEIRITADRRAKLTALLEEALAGAAIGQPVLRVPFASLIGKLQFCCSCVLLGQAHMRALYSARDVLVDDIPSLAAWAPNMLC